MLRALVITPNKNTGDLGDLLAIARAEAQKREHTHDKVDVKNLTFIPELDVYVAVYERCFKLSRCKGRNGETVANE